MTPKDLAQKIDHTLLKPEASQKDIEKLCDEAVTHGFWSVCIQPFWVKYAREYLGKSPVKICTVIGFPHGQNISAVKAFEATQAILDGADELDMVINVGAVKSGFWDRVEEDIGGVVKSTDGKLVKVILETCLLTNEEIQLACGCAERAGAGFVKTSTGFSGPGATIEAVKLMRASVPSGMMVKASGGIRDKETALAMLEAGAQRLGMSAGIAVLKGLSSESDY